MSEFYKARECSVQVKRDVDPSFSLTDYTPSLFHIITLVIFLLAVVHTFMAGFFTRLGHSLTKSYIGAPYESGEGTKEKGFWAETCYFLGEVEVIFGLWVIPLMLTIFFFYSWDTAVDYIDSRDYIEPLFVVVIMCLSATRPIVTLAEKIMQSISRLFRGTMSAWWTTILIVGPMLGSFITEAGAMTLCALLLSRLFYAYSPSKKLAYATLGLLFVNVSVGGILTNFAAPPVLIVSGCWGWDSLYMFAHFGWLALIGVTLTTFLYFIPFRKELQQLEIKKQKSPIETPLNKAVSEKVPIWITLVHVLLLIWLVAHEHDPPIFIGSFLMFLGFLQATKPHQYPLYLKRPILVGFFLAALVIHGGLQGWWIVPLISKLSGGQIMATGAVLTAFNDNASVVYLGSLVPSLSETMKYALMSGVIVGGGLTVIANAPNPAGQMLLRGHFGGRVSPLCLLLGALPPTIVLFLVFYFNL